MTKQSDPLIRHPQIATAAEIGRYFGVPPMAITRWVRRGCPYLRRGPYIFDLEQVEEWKAVGARGAESMSMSGTTNEVKEGGFPEKHDRVVGEASGG